MMIKTVGIDRGKTRVRLAAMAAAGKVVHRRRLSPAKLVAWFSRIKEPACVV